MTKEELDQLEALANAMIVPDHGTLALVAAVRERDAEIARLRSMLRSTVGAYEAGIITPGEYAEQRREDVRPSISGE